MFRAIASAIQHARPKVWLTQVRLSSMKVSSLLPADGAVPVIDHLMSVGRAAQLMADKHVDAIPVTKNNKVVGLFTEHDYFEKVLSKDHQATGSAHVCDVAKMGSELVVARPDDTVDGCIEVMMMKNLMALPVVQPSGRILGTVTLMDLTKHAMATHSLSTQEEKGEEAMLGFSEPSHFPENVVLEGAVVHDEDMLEPQALETLHTTKRIHMQHPTPIDSAYFDGAALFSENSVFPELTREEEVLLEQQYGEMPPPRPIQDDHQEQVLVTAQSKLLSEMDYFSEASDFPEAAPVDEAIQLRAA